MDESRRRRVLRSHRDVPFRGDEKHDQWAMDVRSALDVALERLTVIEVRLQTGSVSVPPPSSDDLLKLFESNAFARFANAYLYFGIRFMAARLLGRDSYTRPPARRQELPSKEHGTPPSPDRRAFDINDVPFALPYPPPIEPDPLTILGVNRRQQVIADEDVEEALAFLDDCMPTSKPRSSTSAVSALVAQHAPRIESHEMRVESDTAWQLDYERWLRGLGHNPAHADYFRRITNGLRTFIRSRVEFYTELEGQEHIDAFRVSGRLLDVTAKKPHTARFGLLDLYWFARLFYAEVSSVGVVTYRERSVNERSLLQLLAERARIDGEDPAEFEDATPLLRAVFDFTCDLILNSVAIACDQLDRAMNPESFPEWPPETVTWRRAYDEELAEVAHQRHRRGFPDKGLFTRASADAPASADATASPAMVGWSRRVRTGEHLENLIGLAFSGGGIRSATFNLGVLQRLQELDLLRGVDYLSTVSGGGYIGSWLLGNVRRTHYWLSQLTDWAPSIEHLRRYSNYLAPRQGLMSVDTWTMWASWIRNALLIQLTCVVWLWVLLVLTRINETVFTWSAFTWLAVFPGNLILVPLVLALTIAVVRSIRTESRPIREGSVLVWGVAPAWIGSFVTAAMLWAERPPDQPSYSQVLQTAWAAWYWPLAVMFGSLAVLSAYSIDTRRSRIIAYGYGVLTAAAAMTVVYLGFCAVRWMFGQFGLSNHYAWMAYVFGPPLVLFAMTLPIIAIIGLIGTDSEDWRREWWTRFGSWIGIWGVGFMLLSLTSVYGPLLTLSAFDHAWGLPQWSTVGGWIATIAGGLMSGNSERTSGGEGRTRTASVLEWFSKIAAIVFIIGAVLIGATVLHVLLTKIFTSDAVSASTYWQQLTDLETREYWWTFLALIVVGLVFSWRFEINIFGLNQFYRNRLVRCYLGATRWRMGMRRPHAFTGFDKLDDLDVSDFRNPSSSNPAHSPAPHRSYRGPFPILNGALNLGGSSDLGVHTRHSASFAFTPLRAGSDRKAVGYAPMYSSTPGGRVFGGGVTLGQAVSVSGAAASPNMGYSTSPLVAFLLTIFNVRLGWWFPNPGKRLWWMSRLPISTWYLVKEMFGLADETNHFINVSDGGHFENLAIYELVRRRCKVIIACDAECDSNLAFGSLGNVIRLCEIDFDARIEIDVDPIRKQKDTGYSRSHCAVGRIFYSNGSTGYLIYMKSSLTSDEDASIEQYHSAHAAFPHESTGDQFFAEDQFESYRRLGYHVAKLTFRDVEHERSLLEMARNLFTLWTQSSDGSSFVAQAHQLDAIWERFRTAPMLEGLLTELMSDRPSPPPDPIPGTIRGEQLAACLELIQLMENVFISLQLDDFWTHPDNRGWVTLFTSWAKSGTFRAAWKQTRTTFGSAFVYFCENRLGL
jgi:hypothetical protein